MYYDFPAQILQSHFIFSEKLHKGTIIRLSRKGTIIARYANKNTDSALCERCLSYYL